MISKLSDIGITSTMAYTAGAASIGLSILSWIASTRAESTERADRWGIFVGEWAPTFFALGVALRLEEKADRRGRSWTCPPRAFRIRR
ncbi:hypothetical protein [Marinactinospora rubrisoli]|uniref:Uncharacterized protein n=1 Tax=Marinactinospora rubrisoli TaxID=2715399 RepID=A0ABW2KHW4_9ACTN